MSQIKINFDLIDAIKQAKGIKKCPKELSMITKPISMLYPTVVLIDSIKEQLPLDSLIIAVAIATTLSVGVEQLILFLTMRQNTMDLARSELNYLTMCLKDLNIETNIDLLLNAKVYNEKYQLKKDEKKGIIRTRYINIPKYNYKKEQVITSIKEEHLLTTKEYLLSVGEPEKKDEVVYTKKLVNAWLFKKVKTSNDLFF